MRVVFFGSTSDSVLVLSRLFQLKIENWKLEIVAVVTQPPRPVGRDQKMTPTPVETWAHAHHVPVLSFPSQKDKPWLFESEETVIDALEPLKADLLVSASYGQKIPTKTISDARFGGLNVHPSILPRWRGADPVPWAIMTGDHQAGVTIVTLAEKFDEGRIIAQKKIPITPSDFADPLRTKLFDLGATLLTESLPDYLSGKNKGQAQHVANTPYARRFTRDDGYEPWEMIQNAMAGGEDAARIDRKFRALTPWPGVWTKITMQQIDKLTKTKTERRLKILALHLISSTSTLQIDSVQLEGKNPVPYAQFVAGYLVT